MARLASSSWRGKQRMLAIRQGHLCGDQRVFDEGFRIGRSMGQRSETGVNTCAAHVEGTLKKAAVCGAVASLPSLDNSFPLSPMPPRSLL